MQQDDNETNDGNFRLEQTKKWVLYPSMGIMLIVAILLQFDKVALTFFFTILGILGGVYTLVILTGTVEKTEAKENSDTGSNQGPAIKKFFVGLITFMILTSLMSVWVVYSLLDGFTNFWINFGLIIGNGYLWYMYVTNSFDQKKEGAILLQLKLNGEYVEWGKNMRPSSWGVCKVTPFIGVLEGKLEEFPEKTFQLTHKEVKDKDSKEDGLVIPVKVKNKEGSSFNVVIRFAVKAVVINNTFIIAKTEGGFEGAKLQSYIAIFDCLTTVLNTVKDDAGKEPDEVEAFRPLRKKMSASSTELLKPVFKKLGFDFDEVEIAVVESTTIEETARSSARAAVATAIGEVATETTKVDGTLANIKNSEEVVGKELAAALVLAIQGDSRREDTNITAGTQGKPGKKGGSRSNLAASLTQAAAYQAMNNDNDGNKEGE